MTVNPGSAPAKQQPAFPADPVRILVRGVNWLGDAVMTTPALQRLRERFPKATITLATQEKLAALWDNHPAIDAIITFSSSSKPWSVGRQLRGERFDLALLFPNSPRSALECWFARVPVRIGYSHGWRDWLLTTAVPRRPGHVAMPKLSPAQVKRLVRQPAAAAAPPASAHQMFDYLHLVATLGADSRPVPPRLAVEPQSIADVQRKFDLLAESEGGRPLFALNPGAEYGPAKRWPAESFIAAAREVHSRTNCRWLILGGPADAPLANRIESALTPGVPVRNLAGRTSLRELCAVLRLSRVVLTNDTGPMHVAAALGTPVVVPFGSTSPALTGPGFPGDPRHRVLTFPTPCSPCFRRTCPIDFRCMNSITPAAAVEAVLAAARTGVGSRPQP